MTIKKSVWVQSVLALFILFAGFAAKAQDATKELTDAMNNSAEEWNKGHLDTFISLYDASATMMFPTGPVGMDGIKNLYQKSYFKPDGLPKQNLKYTDIKVRMLGNDYALMTGGFTLYGNNLPERSGRYSLVWQHTANGWKILHDHSS
ncbi:MAG: YybH family protein [Mucilaginibacter sp.]|uniref:YybH family protein n=1 Tax=Mucilaginibacter sp. L3T2-6 TaxID=3062491 RepID=UPI002674B54D|nr:nuclear transport factor 2 family protein [Mucilaginibacter sp. L3T2-6]MDO3640589.1 nuclear transport factor 2 family protein [Mucilaginibacter sp. L3T2-6]MDV6213072.1 nuclear transport factor 2 family protein [Mucilaginibacter sp. L3T2-6]